MSQGIDPTELDLSSALDLFQHWIVAETNPTDEQRKHIQDSWNGPMVVDRVVPEEDSWAPSWWQGDEDASRSARAAAVIMDAGKKGRRR